MKRYGWASLSSDNGNVCFMTTASHQIGWAIDEVKKYFPNCRAKIDLDLSDDPYYVIIDRLDNKGNEVQLLLLKKLCLSGWAPLGNGELRLEYEN